MQKKSQGRDTKRKSNLAHLELVAPPIVNSMASAIDQHPELVATLRASDIYMIGGRAAAAFDNIKFDEANQAISFFISVPNKSSSQGFIKIEDRLASAGVNLENFESLGVRGGPQFVEIFALSLNGEETTLALHSPDELLWLKGHAPAWLHGLDNSLELACYDLLYVGIATQTDSYDRLIAKGHHARQRILSDEPQRFPGARVTDEIFLFLFRIEPLQIRIFGADSDFDDDDIFPTHENEKNVKDAEKAFVSLLRPKYNKELYNSYPKGRDGLYGSGFDSYSYSIAEKIQLRTAYGAMKGARGFGMPMSNEADFILVEGGDVTVHISGVDFPAS